MGFKKSLFELLNRKRYLCAHEKVSEHKQESTCRAGCSCWNNRPVSDFRPKPRMNDSLDEVEVTDSVEVKEIVCKYGIPVDHYDISYGIVQPNQNLSYILGDHGLSSADIHELNEKAKGVFDVRKIRSGQAYAVFTVPDSTRRVRFFVYEETPKTYVVFDLRGERRVYRGENPVEWKQKEIKGKVESSLWMAMQKLDTSPQLALVLSNIYGWSIDFFSLQKEDEFRVIYEQECVEGKELDNFHILAASFRYSDSIYYAIPFVQDGEELYYGATGNSLEGAFLKAPLDFTGLHPVFKQSLPSGTATLPRSSWSGLCSSYRNASLCNW